MRILVAEDEKQNILLFERVIGKLGHESIIVENGVDAIAHLQNDIFDIVILDLSLPIKDGIQTSEFIRNETSILNNSVPIIIVSGNSELYLQTICEKYGLDGFLTKPFRMSELNDLIKKVLKN